MEIWTLHTKSAGIRKTSPQSAGVLFRPPCGTSAKPTGTTILRLCEFLRISQRIFRDDGQPHLEKVGKIAVLRGQRKVRSKSSVGSAAWPMHISRLANCRPFAGYL